MPAQLLALNEGPAILLDKPILLLGRDLECDIRLDSRKISRRHCCIAQVGDQLVVRDLGSTNGLRINGIRVVEGHLKAGDEFTIGNFRYKVYWGDGVPSASSMIVEKRPEAPPPMDKQASTDRPPNEDDLLEECDEPVPLSDPQPMPPAPPPAKPPRSKPMMPSPASDGPTFKSEPPPPGPNPGTQILPDDLELAPKSDVVPKPPAGG
jgi:pSer/pThr/pTyr-binding forkhead associated (FHA) protein